jgi:hypothetical protein
MAGVADTLVFLSNLVYQAHNSIKDEKISLLDLGAFGKTHRFTVTLTDLRLGPAKQSLESIKVSTGRALGDLIGRVLFSAKFPSKVPGPHYPAIHRHL